MTDMVLVPAARVTLGAPDWVLDWLEKEGQAFPREWFADETPQIDIDIAAFQLDRFPVTNAAFAVFVGATGYLTDAERNSYGIVYTTYWNEIAQASWRHPAGPGSDLDGRADHPVVHISWNDATAYAKWAGKRLPSEFEWEYAARGTEFRLWPWGDIWDATRAVGADLLGGVEMRTLQQWRTWWAARLADCGPLPCTSPVGSVSPLGDSPFDITDMAGNVYEWTSSLTGPYAPDVIDPVFGPLTGRFRVLRGGSWMNFRWQLRCSDRMHGDPVGWSNFATGFRCAADA